jgi:FliI/YscN family ATPase
VGLFAGAGLGKSTLLQQIIRHTAADVVVLCLTGERGREVADFIDSLPEATRARSVVVCATSDAPALLRVKAAEVAATLAEAFADEGKRVLLLMDSLSRFARAAREVGLAAGELPARRGYPPSVFAALPRLLERAGMRPHGSVTAIYSVLVEGDDMEDPIADELRGLLDGHILLRRDLAARGHYPAIDVLHSLSRLMPKVAGPAHMRAAAVLREQLAQYEASRDLIELGAYKAGSNPKLDKVLDRLDDVLRFLRQEVDEHVTLDDSVSALLALAQP